MQNNKQNKNTGNCKSDKNNKNKFNNKNIKNNYGTNENASLKAMLANAGITLKKSLGQNFLIEPKIPFKIADSIEKSLLKTSFNGNSFKEIPLKDTAFKNAEHENSHSENSGCYDKKSDVGVIEIGPGAGVLTKELAKRFKKVVCIELDTRMEPILNKNLSGFSNVEFIFNDVLKVDLKKVTNNLLKTCKQVVVAANLPYYITSPIIMYILESKLNIQSVTVMVQKEAAERICAKIPSRNVGAVTIAVNYYSTAEILFGVSKNCFLPPPNVESAVIRLNIRKEPLFLNINEQNFFKLVKASFIHRRKTLVNSVSSALNINKEIVLNALKAENLPCTVRAENLSLNNFANISEYIFKNNL